MKLTRRELALALAPAAVLAQTSVSSTPAEELKTARERMKANGDVLAAQKVPMATEPAFQFKA
jgi:hypothetical protein